MIDLAVTFEPEAYTLDQRLLMGRHSAGAGFLRAFAGTRPERAWCLSRERGGAAAFEATLRRSGAPAVQAEWIGAHNLGDLARPGLLYRPDPAITADAWRRLQHAEPSAWSVCGITHTTAHHEVMTGLAQLLTGPVEPWDAIVCTSEAVRASVVAVLMAQAEYLRDRFGLESVALPQLPVIPLGVHAADFETTERARGEARRALGLAPDETAFLFVGRLSAYSKAHPVPTYLALQGCAAERRIVLIEAGWFETDAARDAFAADARALAPSVRRLVLDGRDAQARGRAWAAADVFISLSDSIQETFGLTPVEAMAAGLPVVVSDWNGYKETVRHGVDGFRVPTTALPPTAGQPLADRYDLGVDDYHAYCGAAGQFVAVDVSAATDACRRLAADPDLRGRMGRACRARVREAFEWSTVFARYEALWTELAALRRSATAHSRPARRPRPDRQDPFAMFHAYPTAALAPGTSVRLRPGADVASAAGRRDLATVRFAAPLLPEHPLVAEILGALAAQASSFEALRARLGRHPLAVAPAVVWLAKMGLLELAEPERAAASADPLS